MNKSTLPITKILINFNHQSESENKRKLKKDIENDLYLNNVK